MKAPRAPLAHYITDRTLAGAPPKKLAQQVAAYLLSERRVDELDSLLRDVQANWADAGQVEVIAASAHPLTSSVKSDIKQRVKHLYPNAKQIIVTEVRDEQVIGGVRLSLANQQLDASVKAKLNKFKQLTLSGKE